ncbi:MAG: BlaI/MecI/CopY family transcriptional regulator [Pirellulales bacterium]|nr:BlaI/MecI/CopY family transcriptional regulator [Pirellulales bacterium]
MPRPPSNAPTEVELQILRVLWQNGPSTVRQVHNALKDQRETGYSTTLKMMQVMNEKGLLTKNEKHRPQTYRPTVSETQTQTRLVDDLIQRAFQGAIDQLVLRAVSSKHLSEQERAQVKELLRKLEEESQ